MADNDKNAKGGAPLNEASGDYSLTEIDFDSFLSSPDGKPADDTAKFDDDIRSIYDDILGADKLAAQAPAPEPPAPGPFAAPEAGAGSVSADAVPPEAYFHPAPDARAAQPQSSASDSLLDELNSLIGELHSGTKAETEGFGALLSDIEANKAISEAAAQAKQAQIQPRTPAPAPAQEKPRKAAPAPVSEADKFKEIKVDDEIDDLAQGSVLDEKVDAVPPAPVAPAAPAAPAAGQRAQFEYFSQPAKAAAKPAPATPAPAAAPVPMPYAKKAAPEKQKAKKGSSVFPVKGDSTSEIIRKLVLLVSIATIIVSSGILVNTYLYQPSLSKSQNEKAEGDLITGNIDAEASKVMNENKDVEFPEGMLSKYAKLYAANTDMSGWISIPGLEINFPLAQGNDNEHYLTRNIYDKRVKYGVPFFDYRNHLKELDRNTVVYGHNMRYDDMIFGLLENYCTIDGFRDAPVIECNTLYADYKWKVYAVFITNSEAKDDNGNVFNYNFTQLNDTAFNEYTRMLDERKLYTTGVDILPSDKILTLSTCFYEFDGARLVVVARLVRDGEPATVDTSLAETNSNPRYPQAWYDAKGKTNPYA